MAFEARRWELSTSARNSAWSRGDTRPDPGTFLALLSGGDRDELLALGGLRRFERGERLMHQGEPGDRIAVLLDGHVKVCFVDARGEEVVLSFRGPGDVLGELSFTRAEARSGDVVAVEPVAAQVIAATDFRRFMESRGSVALALIDVISGRFRDANRKCVQFAALDTVGRLAARLIELCDRYGDSCDEGVRIRIPITQEDLGGWTASSRASVASALRTMRELGWIKTERRRITVLDVDALEARAA